MPINQNLPATPPSSKPQDNPSNHRNQIRAILARLSLTTIPPELDPKLWAIALDDYVRDLEPYPIAAIEAAATACRRASPMFPKPAHLIEAIRNIPDRSSIYSPEQLAALEAKRFDPEAFGRQKRIQRSKAISK